MKILKALAMVLCFMVISYGAVAMAEESALKIADTSGKVQVKIAPSAEWTDAKIDQALNPQDAIKTGANGKVRLSFSDKSAIALKSQTELIVDKLVWGEAKRDASVKLSMGKAFFSINKHENRSDFKVITPTSVCAVRGTQFFVGQEGGYTDVAVLEGSVVQTAYIPVEQSESSQSQPEVVINAGQSFNGQNQSVEQTDPATLETLQNEALATVSETALSGEDKAVEEKAEQVDQATSETQQDIASLNQQSAAASSKANPNPAP